MSDKVTYFKDALEHAIQNHAKWQSTQKNLQVAVNQAKRESTSAEKLEELRTARNDAIIKKRNAKIVLKKAVACFQERVCENGGLPLEEQHDLLDRATAQLDGTRSYGFVLDGAMAAVTSAIREAEKKAAEAARFIDDK